MINTPWGPWDPMTPSEVSESLAGLDAAWWVAGGYAIETFVGRTVRDHDDVDIGVLRDDQSAVQAHLEGWDLHAADPPGTLRAWEFGEKLPVGVHDVWARRGPGQPWRFQLMLNECEGDNWVYRRDPRVRRALTSCVWQKDGIPYFAPEMQLLFKSKAPRSKDEVDFDAALPLLDDAQRRWLLRAIKLSEPRNPWIGRLTEDRRMR